MCKRLSRGFTLCFFFSFLALKLTSAVQITKVSDEQFDTATRDGEKKITTEAGNAYMRKFLDVMDKPIIIAIRGCMVNRGSTTLKSELVFVVAADGRIDQVLCSSRNAFADCIASKLQVPAILPKPPRGNWPVPMELQDVPKKEKVSDSATVTAHTAEEVRKYNHAIAPYIAKGRKTYPSAKKRFLAGLPSAYKFAVKTRLKDRDGNFEDSFIEVKSIKNGIIAGTINSHLTVVKEFKTGQSYKLPESEVDDWVILRPDATEEGNFVGKFLDTYQSH